MKFLRQLVFCLTLAAVPAGRAGEAHFITELAAGRAQRIVVYGTSLTANAAWPGYLETTLRGEFGRKCRVINAAGGGKDSRWGVENLHERVLRQRPDVVFIEFAINDALAASRLPVAESMANLESMISEIRREKPFCDVAVLIMNPPTGDALRQRPEIRDYERGYREVARRNAVRLIDFSRAWREIIHHDPQRWAALAPDGLHPNATGSREVILPILLRKTGCAVTGEPLHE